ncbi:radical SAM/SPASM domain-containing protein [Thiorhodovibrio frisius]|uniref:Radical SAM additional 4Fe4S-binding domain protein n=1 Tax=Thiorhodovibrio frisius TaxID=631362 RepID=H8Z1L3_9GAMM|nr:radical SAM protein [Thiorhodovibrio frisius]EIC21458.1 radical SAM additional 4Fe4S-binding domain protein [Thiorhodovibrio frisius]WPL24044.1 Antilisterial bacteriocin subtilosin biosynthesis protein AlbA [Thiorhodovibrio frisius]
MNASSTQGYPRTAVWELTLACNMRCQHCGSSCTNKSPDELDTEAALDLCDQLADLGVELVTLSGGEPLLRDDWDRIGSRLSEKGVRVNMISNGWLLDSDTASRACEAGFGNCAVSLDGTKEVHDTLRRDGSFERACNALETLRQAGLGSAVITTVMQDNLALLPKMRPLLEDLGIQHWQLQLGMPMGKMTMDRVIAPEQVEEIVSFGRALLDSSPIQPVLADCVGYYSHHHQEIRKSYFDSDHPWQGCNAGKSNIGILHNGDILGCTSIRAPEFVEGNIRRTPLSVIWNRPGAFAWNRDFSVEDLGGFCAKCRYGEICLGGCQNVKLTMTQSLRDNPYCAYRTQVEELSPKIHRMRNVDQLLDRARKALAMELFEVAETCLLQANTLSSDNLDILQLLGYAHFRCRQYEKSRDINEQALMIAPNDAYSWHGLGNALAKLGNIPEAKQAMLRARDQAGDAGPLLSEIENDLSILMGGEIQTTNMQNTSIR